MWIDTSVYDILAILILQHYDKASFHIQRSFHVWMEQNYAACLVHFPYIYY